MAPASINLRVTRRIRDALAAKRLTQEWLAESSGIPPRTLARRLHETNPSPMSIDELDLIASLLRVDMAALVDESDMAFSAAMSTSVEAVA